ncbi:hypothetical protein LTR64_004652 [Lithohypha guttulata]|uniref:J domain-containing protein n=1 Tax=Lithohypha guttulata TaxID=1690604 RepID=A0AAN7T2C0_9EURO|nr:hypothetical protein LTR51_006050 [Lithohypha guttulata]KAK5088256.1 hypothetical protein LTR05_002473 [Lithohypha guttulata]
MNNYPETIIDIYALMGVPRTTRAERMLEHLTERLRQYRPEHVRNDSKTAKEYRVFSDFMEVMANKCRKHRYDWDLDLQDKSRKHYAVSQRGFEKKYPPRPSGSQTPPSRDRQPAAAPQSANSNGSVPRPDPGSRRNTTDSTLTRRNAVRRPSKNVQKLPTTFEDDSEYARGGHSSRRYSFVDETLHTAAPGHRSERSHVRPAHGQRSGSYLDQFRGRTWGKAK